MIVIYLLLLPLFILSTFLFFKLSPHSHRQNIVHLYNFVTLFIVVIVCFCWGIILRIDMSRGTDFGWWPVITFIYSLVIATVVFAISGAIRNFIIFKPPQ